MVMASLAGLSAGLGGSVAADLLGIVTGPLGHVSKHISPSDLPSAAEIFNAYRCGYMSEDDCHLSLSFVGVNWGPEGRDIGQGTNSKGQTNTAVWDRVYRSGHVFPSASELRSLWNRGAIGASTYDRWMRRNGVQLEEVRNALRNFINEVPGVNDILRFASLGILGDTSPSQIGLDDGYTDAIAHWMRANGYGGDDADTDADSGTSYPHSWGKAYWRAHWTLPTMGDAWEMLHRLRPTGGPQGGPRDPSGQVLTDDDLTALQEANTIPPYWRAKLRAINYRPIGLRQINQLVRYGLTDRKDLVERWQDVGFSKDTAETMADVSLRAEDSRKFKQQTSGIRSRVISAYEVGTISRNDAEIQLYRLSLESSEDASEFDSLPPGEQLSLAAADPAIGVALDTVELDIVARQAKSAISAIKRQFVSGKIGEGEARSRLTGMGILDARVTGYLTWWGNQLDVIRRELSASQVVKFTREGLISPSDAANRLINLGYGSNDAYIISRDIQRDIEMDLAKAAKAGARTEQQREEALIRQAKAAVTAHKSARSELARHGSPAKLGKWLKDGLIGEDEVTARLLAMDWPQADIDRLIAEAEMPPKAKVPTGSATSGTP